MNEKPRWYAYYLMVRDNKGENDNIVILNSYDSDERDEAFAALKSLQSVCDETVTPWLEVETDGTECREIIL